MVRVRDDGRSARRQRVDLLGHVRSRDRERLGRFRAKNGYLSANQVVCVKPGADEKHEARRIAADDLPADVAGYALPRKDVEAALAECRWRGMNSRSQYVV